MHCQLQSTRNRLRKRRCWTNSSRCCRPHSHSLTSACPGALFTVSQVSRGSLDVCVQFQAGCNAISCNSATITTRARSAELACSSLGRANAAQQFGQILAERSLQLRACFRCCLFTVVRSSAALKTELIAALEKEGITVKVRVLTSLSAHLTEFASVCCVSSNRVLAQ